MTIVSLLILARINENLIQESIYLSGNETVKSLNMEKTLSSLIQAVLTLGRNTLQGSISHESNT